MSNKIRRYRSKSPSVSGGSADDVETKDTKVKIPKSLRKKIEDCNNFMIYYMKKNKITREQIESVAGLTPNEYFIKVIMNKEWEKQKNSGKKYFEVRKEMLSKYDSNKIISEMRKNGYEIREPKKK